MTTRSPVWVPDVRSSTLVSQALASRLGLECSLDVPLLGPEGPRGALACAWRTPRMLRADEIDLAVAVGAEISAALVRLEAEDRLRAQATRDPLTGLLNHAAFHEEVSRALAGIARARGPVALVLADLDHLKYINDFHGHAVGDEALRAVAEVLTSVARASDAVGRLGGDEFGWLLVGSSPDDAVAAAQRAVRLVAARTVEPVGPLSLSAGVSVTVSTIEPEILFERADAALYGAKAGGRGTAVMSRTRRARAGGAPSDARPSAGTDVAAADTLGAAAQAVAREWTALFHAAACVVSLLEDGGLTLREIAGYIGAEDRETPEGERYRVADYPPTRAAIEHRRVYTCRVDDPEADPAELGLLRELGHGALLLVPLVLRGRPIGIVELYAARPREFTADEQRLAPALAGYVAAVFERHPELGRIERSAGGGSAASR